MSHATGFQSRQGLNHGTVTLAHCIRPHEHGRKARVEEGVELCDCVEPQRVWVVGVLSLRID